MVSVWVITYNHEKFISQALESLVNQRTNFEFNIIIGEDFSMDNTLSICKNYAMRYPGKIVLLPSDKNWGPIPNTFRTLDACKGKYIALCEGDDFWTDENKLQKQVDFLENNSEFSMCFSDALLVRENDKNSVTITEKLGKEVFTMEDVITKQWIIPTATVLFRNTLPNPLPEFFFKSDSGDIIFQILMADLGKIKYMNQTTAAYRQHEGGITRSEEYMFGNLFNMFDLFENFNKYYQYKYHNEFRKKLFEMSKTILIYGSRNLKGISKIKYVFKRGAKYLKYSERIDLKEVIYYTLILFFPFVLKIKR